jgi:hypothetical protein
MDLLTPRHEDAVGNEPAIPGALTMVRVPINPLKGHFTRPNL